MDDLEPPDPPLAGRKVALRPFRESDAAAVAAACQDADIPRFTMMPDAMSVDDAAAWIAAGIEWWPRGVARFAITTPTNDTCLGQVGVQLDLRANRAEAFYWLARDARGRGLASEALDLVARWAFDVHRVARVQLVTHVDNAASQAVAERCGFEREGILRAWEPVKGSQPDVVMFGRLPHDVP